MSRRRVLVSLGAAAVVATAALVAINDGEPRPASRALEHLGMVSGTVWVANQNGTNLTAIDSGQNNIATTLTGIRGPHNVQVSPNGRTMWAVSGSDSLDAMVDSKTLGLHGTLPTGGMPAHVVLSPDGRTACATSGADNAVSAISTKTVKPVAAIPVGSGSYGLRPAQTALLRLERPSGLPACREAPS